MQTYNDARAGYARSLYALDAAAELSKDWTYEEIAALRRDVPRLALKTPFRGAPLQDVARRVVAIARDANVVLDLRSVEPTDDARLIAALLP